MSRGGWAISALVLLGAACNGAASAGPPGREAVGAATPLPQASASSPSPTKPSTVLTVPAKLTGGHGDVDGRWIAWQSNATSFGLDHDALWIHRTGWKRPKLVKSFPKGDLGAGVSLSFPYLAWVEYRETGNTSGPWKIYLHNLKSEHTRVAASWRTTGAGKNQPIPLPDLDPTDSVLVWHQMEEHSGKRSICIQRLDVATGARSSDDCTDSKTLFPHLARVNEGRVAYVVNTGPGGEQGQVSEPRSPDYPELEQTFAEGGALSEWDMVTREAEADEGGVAWIAESTEYQGGARIYYWDPDDGVLSMPTRSPRFPASQLELVDDAVVWHEPDRVNDVLVARRSLMGCDGAGVHLAKPWFNRKPHDRRYASTFLLAGASRDQILVGLIRSIPRDPYMLPFKLAVFPVPDLPTSCEG